MNVEFVVFCLTLVFSFLALVAIVAIVFGQNDIAKTAVSALAKQLENAIKVVKQAIG